MVRKVIVPAQDHADFPYLVPDGIPAWQREHGAVHVGGIVQGQYLLGYRVQGDERFHPGLLPVDADEPPPLRRRPDMAPMERYFNTLKNECTNLYEFETEKALYQKVEEFAYVDYNHVRPHSFNDYRTPYEARMAA